MFIEQIFENNEKLTEENKSHLCMYTHLIYPFVIKRYQKYFVMSLNTLLPQRILD